MSAVTSADTADDRSAGLTPRRPPGGPGAAPGAWRGGWSGLIHGYQLARAGRPTGCRYLPTCSEYAVEAIERHGAVAGDGLRPSDWPGAPPGADTASIPFLTGGSMRRID